MSSDSEWTNCESSGSKAAIVVLNYVKDPFCGLLCPQPPLRRSPEINRGYFARYMAVDHVIRHFCSREGASAQVVNIGSGFDSLYWRLATDESVSFARVVDIDSPQVVANKSRVVDRTEQLWRHLEDRRQPGSEVVHSRHYHAVGLDATKARRLIQVLTSDCEVRPEHPVLFVFECVLLYWTEDQCQHLIHALSHAFINASFVVFDLVNTEDAFARLMQESLSRRDTPLLGVRSGVSLDQWRHNFVVNGCPNVSAWDMSTVYERLLPASERTRVERIEFLDERELLTQLLSHYCLVIGSNSSQGINDWPKEDVF